MRRRFILLILMTMLFVLPVAAKAQQEARLLSAYISIWPEYEDSPYNSGKLNVLVINRIVFDPQIGLPAKITVQIPATALKPHVVAVGETSEMVSDENIEFTTTPNGDWIDVLVTATAPAIQVEYYDYNLAKNGASREYIYRWPGTYAVNSLHIDVRVPLHATNMKSEPDATTAGTDSDGFKFGEMTVPNVPAGEVFTLKINYDRDTDKPSSSFLTVESSEPLEQPVEGQFSLASYMPWILGVLALLLVAGGVIWYGLSSRAGGNLSKPRKRGLARKQKKEKQNGNGEIYCHECGKRAQPGDQFCRTCGARLRQGESQ